MTPIQIILPSYIKGSPRYSLAEASRMLGIARRRLAKLAGESGLGIYAEEAVWFTQEELDKMATTLSPGKLRADPRP